MRQKRFATKKSSIYKKYIPPMFIGTIGYVGEQIDVYELVEGGILCLKTSMTLADWNRRSRYS